MAAHKPLVLTPTGIRELPAGDTLGASDAGAPGASDFVRYGDLPSGGSSGPTIEKFRSLSLQLAALKGSVVRYFGGLADDYVAQSGMAVIEQAQSYPVMTGNTTPAPYAVSDINGNSSGNEVPWKAFDGVYSAGGGQAWVNTNSTLPAWLQRQNPTSDQLWAYTLTARTDGYGKPSAWTFSGSNDGSAWTVLDTQSGITLVNGTRTVFAIPSANRGFYRYWRITISALTSSGQNPSLAEFELLREFAPFDSSSYFFTAATQSFTNVSGGSNYALDLRSVVFAADAVPTLASIFLQVQAVNGTLTPNTNLVAQVSRDAGATWLSFSLQKVGVNQGFTILEANGLSLANLPSGTSIRYRFTTDTSVGVVIDSVVLDWV